MLQRSSISLLLAASLLSASVATTPFAFAAPAAHDPGTTLRQKVDTALTESRTSYSVPDVERTIITEDGEKVTLAKNNEHIYRTAPLNRNLLTHEARVSLQGLAKVAGSSQRSIHTLTVGYLMGCQIDASEPAKLEVSFPMQIQLPSPRIGTEGDFSAPDFEQNRKSLGVTLLRPQLWFGYVAGVTLSDEISYNVNVKPGRIAKVPLASFSFRGNRTSWADLRDVHMFIDGCPGNVSLRSYVEYLDGAISPRHFPTPSSETKNSAKLLNSKKMKKPKRARFAQQTDSLKQVKQSKIRLPRLNPDQSVSLPKKKSKRGFKDKYPVALTPREKAQQEAYRDLTRKMAEVGNPSGASLDRPYGKQNPDTVEGLKFTIHGAVRWMSTILPQTDLATDARNREKVVREMWEPVQEYAKRFVNTLASIFIPLGIPSPKGLL
ncbi:MspA family porin [Lawsonella clevelandensis]|uniref:Uncharacterized protein n=1 Tax=Lawsonella clevelandensis TaxID=1528099 RepID=A0A0M5L622_9ACTN|nr:MspA family porin [Lawsonella clevelandensis]ALE18709.1 hypothetical protein AL705_02310 [Lawsonella clevelandensis]ALE34396.1 hypothetical protein IY73_02345 [Lawsonella clevelandensis]MDU7192764.1 MspA family porin [Lawsonella clevelandensis]